VFKIDDGAKIKGASRKDCTSIRAKDLGKSKD
jgi:hypothetical protein